MKREISRNITKGKVLLLGVGMGLALMAMAACGSGEPPTGEITYGIAPRSAAAYQELLQNSLATQASSVSGIGSMAKAKPPRSRTTLS